VWMNQWEAECHVDKRLAEVRHEAATQALVRSAQGPHGTIWVALGLTLIRLGQWLLGGTPVNL